MARHAERSSRPLGAIRLDFRALVYQDGEFWVAHCLECDLATQGDSPKDAVSELNDALEILIDYAASKGDLRPLYLPAPLKLWTLFAEISEKKSPKHRRGKHTPSPFGLRTQRVPVGSE